MFSRPLPVPRPFQPCLFPEVSFLRYAEHHAKRVLHPLRFRLAGYCRGWFHLASIMRPTGAVVKWKRCIIWYEMERKHGCAGCLTVLAVVVVIGLLSRSPDKSKSNPAPAPSPAPTAVGPHEQHEKRLAELKLERRQSLADFLAIGLGYEARIRRDLAIVRDLTLRSADPFPDPNQEQRLLADLNAAIKDNAEKKAQLDALDAEIAKEEAAIEPSPPQSAPAPAAQASPPPPQAEASKPTSGVLCNGPVEVRQNWEFTFRNLPSGQLKFTFDHDAWLPILSREPDGTQTLIMRSIKPGIQTKCDIQWEVVRDEPARWVSEKTEHGWVSRKELVTKDNGISLSAEQRQQVTDIRQHALDTIEAFNGILNASSSASRAELYCRFYVDQSPSMVPGIRSEKQAEQRYAELMRSEPTTREWELNRQYQLRAIRDRMEAFAQNVSMCRGVVTAGAQTIPGPDELRKQLAAERLAVSKADELLAHH